MSEQTLPVEQPEISEEQQHIAAEQKAKQRILDMASDAFNRRYLDLHPMPQAPKNNLLKALDIEFWIGIVEAVSTIYLNGVRTGSAFYSAAIKIPGMQDQLALGKSEAIAAVLSYELLLLLYGISHGKRHLNLSPWLKWISLAVAFLTVTIAGLWVSSLISEKLVDWTNGALIGLMIAMAFASVLALAAGEILGVSWAQAKNVMANGHTNYLAEVKAWEEARAIAWDAERGYWTRKFTPRKAPTMEKRAPGTNGNGNHSGEKKSLLTLILEEYDRRGVDPRVQILSHKEIANALSRRVGQEIKDNSVSVTLKRWLEKQAQGVGNVN